MPGGIPASGVRGPTSSTQALDPAGPPPRCSAEAHALPGCCRAVGARGPRRPMVLVEELEDDPPPAPPAPPRAPPAAVAPAAPQRAAEPPSPPGASVEPSPSSPSRWGAAFEAVLSQILLEYEGQDKVVRDGMESGMRKLFDNPYCLELGTLLGGSPLVLEDPGTPSVSCSSLACRMFELMSPPSSGPRRERLMKFKLMSVFYTLHRRDGAIVDRFMHWLDSLVALLAEDHNVIQSQATELLMEMLSPLMQLPHAGSLRQKHLHHQVYCCLRSQAFWRSFAAIVAEPREVFPNSHANCVRILAGALGWLRPEDGCLPDMAAPPDMREAVRALQQYLGSGPAMKPDTRGVAEDLLQELSGTPLFRADPLPEGPELKAARGELFGASAEGREDSAHAWQALKLLGGAAFRGGKLWPAEAAYRLALQEGGAAVPAAEASLIESNRALVLLKAGHAEEAAAAAASALEHDPSNAKAAFRRAQALLQLLGADPAGGPEAAATIGAALDAAELAADLEPKDAKVSEVLAKARALAERLPARAAAAGGPPGPAAPAPGGLDDMD
ncbi:unnamed protein product [Prorocentrum cordatum]|uniref:Uncharacterized protein n=2 Tax=Prorocentrum cordatum TaxID=2364126 RepID=A0ABN9T5I7_9DINO|nr:unnamed protein product [Polarella glacialis]